MAAAMDVRSRVLEEIVATERTFVESLRTCIAVFHAPLEAAVGSRCEDVDGPLGRLLKELALLEPFNSALLGELEAEVAGNGNVGRVFRRFAPFLKMFSRYLELYEAWSDDRKARGGDPSGDRDVCAFLGAAAADPRCRSLDLASFLVAPVQRVPRYRLLLEELAKRPADSHGDRADLDAALALVSEAAGHNNNALAEDAHHATLAAAARAPRVQAADARRRLGGHVAGRQERLHVPRRPATRLRVGRIVRVLTTRGASPSVSWP